MGKRPHTGAVPNSYLESYFPHLTGDLSTYKNRGRRGLAALGTDSRDVVHSDIPAA